MASVSASMIGGLFLIGAMSSRKLTVILGSRSQEAFAKDWIAAYRNVIGDEAATCRAL